MFNGRRQPSRDGTSRMTRECQVRICEGLGVKFPGPTRHEQTTRPRQRLPTLDAMMGRQIVLVGDVHETHARTAPGVGCNR